jgi:hypothetical protein
MTTKKYCLKKPDETQYIVFAIDESEKKAYCFSFVYDDKDQGYSINQENIYHIAQARAIWNNLTATGNFDENQWTSTAPDISLIDVVQKRLHVRGLK